MARPRGKGPDTKKWPVPEEYLAEHDYLPDGFEEAFAHAKGMNNTDKAAILYAEAHHGHHAKDEDAPA